ncbi:MAG: hypothetical protein GTO61_03020, partial [Gemmatimonadales bacterium]|nr:hypothetical protein [Gemmatimonadales bacterium]
MTTHRTSIGSDSGISAIWVAIVLIFLIGATALAVDASEFFQQARSQQRA